MAKAKRYEGPLTAHLGFWLRFVSNHVSGGFRQKLAKHGVTVAEWALMRELFDEGLPPSMIATRLGMTRGGVTKLADKLESRGLIVRTASDGDRRRQTLALSATGRRLAPQLAALADLNECEFFGHLPKATVQQLTEHLRGLVEHHQLRSVPIQ